MQPDDLSITVQEGVILVRVESPGLDEHQSQDMLAKMLAALDQTPSIPVILNLSKVATMPSMSIGALVTLWKKVQDGRRRLILVDLQPPVRNTLAVCRLDKLFEFSDSEDDAKLRLRPAAV